MRQVKKEVSEQVFRFKLRVGGTFMGAVLAMVGFVSWFVGWRLDLDLQQFAKVLPVAARFPQFWITVGAGALVGLFLAVLFTRDPRNRPADGQDRPGTQKPF